jgi:hypothetical protein
VNCNASLPRWDRSGQEAPPGRINPSTRRLEGKRVNVNVPTATENMGTSLFDRFSRTMMAVPTEAYYAATLGSILGSALLYLSGKRHVALFVGEWAPTFLVFALSHKLLHPSGQDVGHQIGAAFNELMR